MSEEYVKVELPVRSRANNITFDVHRGDCDLGVAVAKWLRRFIQKVLTHVMAVS